VPLSEDPEARHDLPDPSCTSVERLSSSTSAEHTIAVLREGVAAITHSISATSKSISPSRAPRAQDGDSSLGPAQSHLSPRGPSLEKAVTTSTAGVDITYRSTTPAGSMARMGDTGVWLSVCSNAGIAWVCETTASLTFADIAERFGRSVEPWAPTSAWPGLGATRAEPSEETAWEYVNGELFSHQHRSIEDPSLNDNRHSIL
jgi:hypothetical protein